MKLTGRQIIKISALVEKMGIKIDAKKDVEELGSEVIWQLLTGAHKAEQEVSEVLAAFMECEPEEALDIDLLEKWYQFTDSDKGKNILGFFQSAAALKAQD